MKRLWLGVGILVGLLLLGFLTTWFMVWIHEPLGAELAKAEELARTGDWEEAVKVAHQARQRWEHYRSISAAVTDHAPMEQIDALFLELETYIQQREQVHFCAVCAQLSGWVEAVADAQRITWWSVL